MTSPFNSSSVNTLSSLTTSPRMPVMFLGHGSPMNAIEDNAFRQSWQALGREFGTTYAKPQLILCISAHWLTTGSWLTAMDHPKTIHDFGGFPKELFAQNYPAPGAPLAAREISVSVSQHGNIPLGLDVGEWGLDHGSWGVLKPMFPLADIPVLQLSMDYNAPMAAHVAIGEQLRALRERGVLIVGSGNLVHNLRAARFDVPVAQAFDWAIEFDKWAGVQIETGNIAALQDFQQLGFLAQQAHPTFEHYLPVLYAAAAAYPDEKVRSFNTRFQGASISMRSVIWG